MKIRMLIIANLAVLLLASWSARAADSMTKFSARSGSKMRMEGTSNIHDWQVESPLILGYLEVGPNFPVEPGQAATPGKVDVKAEASVTVRSLKSIEKDGKPYSDRMDEVMDEKLKMTEFPKIVFHLSELTLKEPARSKDAAYIFDAKGDLAIAGVTNSISMPINVLPLPDKKIKVSGTVTIKMTDFKIEPPAPKIALGAIKTGDDVKLIFDWMLGPQKTAAASAK
jgi:polyisoprenoid-binding protein YceI